MYLIVIKKMTDFYNFQDYFRHQMFLQGNEKNTDEATKEEIIAVANQLLINFQITEFERQRVSGLADQLEAELKWEMYNRPQRAQVCPPPPPSPPASPETHKAADTLLELKAAGIFGGAPAENFMFND